VVISPHVTATGINIHAEVGEEFNGDVAVLSRVTNVASDFRNVHATIDWGDGSDTSEGTFSLIGGKLHVSGSHAYAATGKFTISVGVSQTPIVPPGHPNPFFAILIGQTQSNANVTEDVHGGRSLTVTAGQRFRGVLGAFEFANVDMALHVTIDWGDGTTWSGSVVKTSLDDYNVIGWHTYANAGNYKAHVTVKTSQIATPNRQFPLTEFDASIHVTAQ
jgi:hypothetical protein